MHHNTTWWFLSRFKDDFSRRYTFSGAPLVQPQTVQLFLPVLFFFANLLLVVGLCEASSYESLCKLAFQKKQFVKAANCYRMLSLKPLPNVPNADAPLYQDRYLRNAAISFHAAAKVASRIERKGYLLEQAIKQLTLSFERGYCEVSNRCRSNRTFAEQLQKEIGYVPLLIVSKQGGLRILVEGYLFKAQKYRQFNQKLRPGSFKVSLFFPDGKVRVRKIILKPGKSVDLIVRLQKIQVVEKRIIIAKKIPAVVLISYIVGGSLVLVGSGGLVFGVIQQQQLNDRMLDPSQNPSLSDLSYNTGFDNAQNLKWIGGLAAGVGAIGMGVGLLIHLSYLRRPTKVRAPGRSASKHSMRSTPGLRLFAPSPLFPVGGPL